MDDSSPEVSRHFACLNLLFSSCFSAASVFADRVLPFVFRGQRLRRPRLALCVASVACEVIDILEPEDFPFPPLPPSPPNLEMLSPTLAPSTHVSMITAAEYVVPKRLAKARPVEASSDCISCHGQRLSSTVLCLCGQRLPSTVLCLCGQRLSSTE